MRTGDYYKNSMTDGIFKYLSLGHVSACSKWGGGLSANCVGRMEDG